MELKKHLDPRYIFTGLYVFAFLVYIFFGLQPAEASSYEISTELLIPAIGLVSDVTELALENNELKTPDSIVGSYSESENKVFLIGHSSTVFNKLDEVKKTDMIFYNKKLYIVVNVEISEKAEINMNRILAETNQETLIVMTCAGENLGGGDATHRLIITAIAIK